MSTTKFIIVWSSGHCPPRPVYYRIHPCTCQGRKHARGHWGATYERSEAHQFDTSQAAVSAWNKTHAWPEDYQHFLASGSTRIEPVHAPELCLTTP